MSTLGGPDALSLVFRAISFVLLLNAAGIPIFLATFGHLLSGSVKSIAQLGWKLSIASLVFVVGQQLLEAARMAGEMSGMTDPTMQAMSLRSPVGAAFITRAAGLVLIAAGLRWREVSRGGSTPADGDSRAAVALAVSGTVVCIGSFALTGHTSVNSHRAAAALLILHVTVVSFWMGSLWPLYLAPNREQRQSAARLIDAFSRTAAWLVPGILLAGAGLIAFLVPGLSTFKQPYGRLLLAKITVFALLMALAALNKWRFGPACAAGETRAFRQTVVVEYSLICLALAITATMTMFYSPEGP
jgi:putative copper resistance protein D